MMKVTWLLIFAGLIAFKCRAETVFHVAPTGNDNDSGTLSAPYATLERAARRCV